MRLTSVLVVALGVAAVVVCGGLGCGGSSGVPDGGFVPDLVCPGSSECPGDPAGPFEVGYAQADITPDLAARDTYTDENGDGQWQESEPWTDVDGDGVFNPVFVAGFGSARVATAVHDPLWSRALVIRSRGLTVAIAVLDLVGLFYDEVLKIRAQVKAQRPDLDLVLVMTTHNHEGPDTLGIWGPDQHESGVYLAYNAMVGQRCAESIVAAAAALQPAVATFAGIDVEDAGGDLTPYVDDSRAPTVINPRLTVLDFAAAGGGARIATLVNWSNHPEALGGDNTAITSDFPHYLRTGMEEGFTRQGTTYAGTGAPVIYVNGAVGGLMTTLHTRPIADDGTPVPAAQQESFAAAAAIGHGVAAFALRALGPGGGAVLEAAPDLAFRTISFVAPLDNTALHVAYFFGIFDRALYEYDPRSPIDVGNLPHIRTEIDYVTFGPASIITVPGELFPELFLGGYDGSYRGTYALIEPDNPNPPDLAAAPPPPYLRDLMAGEHRMVFGLANDEIGYIVPAYDFKLDPLVPYLEQAPGDHYEEIVSLGERVEDSIVGTARKLIEYQSGR
ncbi:MAG: hypothetical protein HY906_08200 [Deltaproteobacteria bacterium]|nr:hypothetical protein [Deltaproteobacteria bacterium]